MADVFLARDLLLDRLVAIKVLAPGFYASQNIKTPVKIAVVVLVTTLGLRSRLDRPEKRPHPLSMARMAVLGKASAHVGPVVGGLYGGYLLVLLPGLEIDARRERAILCLVALAGAVGLSLAGLLLERTCRVPPADTDDTLPAAPA